MRRAWVPLNRLLPLLILLFTGPPMHAQLNKAMRDSLQQRLASTTDPHARLAPLQQLAWTYLFSEAALPYLQELDSLTLLIENDPDPAVRAQVLSTRSRMFYQRGYQAKFRRRIREAQQDFREAVRYGRLARDTLATANAMNAMGISYAALHMPQQALQWYDKELELILTFAERPAMYTAHIQQHRADVLMSMGRYNEAQEALDACDTTAADRHAQTLMGRERLAAHRGDTALALACMARAEAVVQGSRQSWDQLSVWEPYARFLLQADQPERSLQIARKAVQLADNIGDHAAQAGCLVIAGQASLHLGDTHGAERALQHALAIARVHGYVGLSRETGDDGCMVRAAELLKELYKQQGRTDEALAITELWANWKDSLRSIEGREELLRFDLQQAALADSIADAQRVAEATTVLRSEVALERQQRQRLLFIGGLALAGALLLLVYLLGRRKRERLLAGHALQRAQDEHMIRDLRQRERMSEDLHEELGAGLTALKLWSDLDLAEEQDPRKQQLLKDRAALADELVASLRQIIWAINSPSGSLRNLVDYLNDAAHLHCARHGLRLRVQVGPECPPIPLSADQRRGPYLILKEALTNTVRHSGADTVDLRILWMNGLHMEIQDNGRGYQGEAEQLPGNGLRTMRRRVSHLGGQVTFDGAKGMRITVSIPMGGGT